MQDHTIYRYKNRPDLHIFDGIDQDILPADLRTQIDANVCTLLSREREWSAKIARGLLEQAQRELAQLRWISGLIATGAAIAGFIVGSLGGVA